MAETELLPTEDDLEYVGYALAKACADWYGDQMPMSFDMTLSKTLAAAAIAAWNRRALPLPDTAEGRWRTIDSAPKDGTAILVYQQTPGDHQDRMAVGWRWHPSEPWKCADYPGLWPTHWQPLPSPPVPSQEGASETEEQT